MRNFNDCMAIISALNHSAIQRLKKTWEVSAVFRFSPHKHKPVSLF